MQNGVAFTYTHETSCTIIWLLALIYDNTSHKETSFLHQALPVAHTVEVGGSHWAKKFPDVQTVFQSSHDDWVTEVDRGKKEEFGFDKRTRFAAPPWTG